MTNNTFYVIPKNSDLKHYGVLGMKWGVRRYQNADGSLTEKGLKRYGRARAKADKAIANYRSGNDKIKTRLKDVRVFPLIGISTRNEYKLDGSLDKAIKRNDTTYIKKILKTMNKDYTDKQIQEIANIRMNDIKRIRNRHIVDGAIAGGLAATALGLILVTNLTK